MGMDRGQLSDPRWEFDHFSLFSAILGHLSNFTTQMIMNSTKISLLSPLKSVLRYMYPLKPIDNG